MKPTTHTPHHKETERRANLNLRGKTSNVDGANTASASTEMKGKYGKIGEEDSERKRDETNNAISSWKTNESSAITYGTAFRATKQHQPASTNESYNDMMQRISSSQKSIQEICDGIKELQTSVNASSSRDDSTSKSVENLIAGVTKSHGQVRGQMSEFEQILLDFDSQTK